jgi:hypothetical protein
VEITLTDDGFQPAVVVVQRNIPARWVINIDSLDPGSGTLLFPAFFTVIETRQGENVLQMFPDDDFDFSTGDSIFYGYVKVVDDINRFDSEAVRAQVVNHETLMYPDAYFEQGSGGGSGCPCCSS